MADTIEHPLLKKEITRIPSWGAWLEHWNRPEACEAELLGLLHSGFTFFGDYTRVFPANVCFYLEVADGSRNESFFSSRQLYGGEDTRQKMLLRLSRKALKMLCQYFFRRANKESEMAPWEDLVVDPAVFEKLLWFFRPMYFRHESNFPPYPSSFTKPNFEDETLRTFLQDFFKFVLTFKSLPPRGKWHSEKELARDAQAREMFIAAYPRILEIMDEMGSLDLLSPKVPYQSESITLGAAGMAKLEELAMIKNKRFGNEVERYESLEAAVFDGCQAASVLAILRIRQAEGERQEQIKEAERLRAEAEERLEALKPKAPAAQ